MRPHHKTLAALQMSEPVRRELDGLTYLRIRSASGRAGSLLLAYIISKCNIPAFTPDRRTFLSCCFYAAIFWLCLARNFFLSSRYFDGFRMPVTRLIAYEHTVFFVLTRTYYRSTLIDHKIRLISIIQISALLRIELRNTLRYAFRCAIIWRFIAHKCQQQMPLLPSLSSRSNAALSKIQVKPQNITQIALPQRNFYFHILIAHETPFFC